MSRVCVRTIHCLILLSVVCWSLVCASASAAGQAPGTDDAAFVWHHDYREATETARRQCRMLLIVFEAAEHAAAEADFETNTLGHPLVAKQLGRYVLAKLPVDYQILVGGEPVVLLEHDAFREMRRQRGVAIIDYQNLDTPYYAHVVSAFPFDKYGNYGPRSLGVALDLPRGSLTQRTMIFAVRIHPEGPKSTIGDLSPILVEEAESHSKHQAQIGVQGHHRWDFRFHRILGRFRRRRVSSPTEVVAESWPGEDLVEAAIECVHSWRQSPGHWGAVRSQHALFGYDMKRSTNGVWYATGIFAGHRK